MLNRLVDELEAQRSAIMQEWGRSVLASKLSSPCQEVTKRLGELLYADVIQTVRGQGNPDLQRYKDALQQCPLTGPQDVFETLRLLRELEDHIWEHLPTRIREADVPLVRHLAALDQAAFASMVAIFAAMHERWTAHLQTLATTDTLTGCLSRGQLETELREEWERSNRYGRPLSLLMADVDNMKAVNDRYGHQSGDALLREVARFIKDAVRQVDIVGRYGGDEFLVIMPETSLEGALAVGRRLVSQVHQLQPPLSLPGPITLSIGMADSSPGYESVSAMLEAADRALHLAKSAGGDALSDGKSVTKSAQLGPAPQPKRAEEAAELAEPAALSEQLRSELAALRRQREELSQLIASLMEKLSSGRT